MSHDILEREKSNLTEIAWLALDFSSLFSPLSHSLEQAMFRSHIHVYVTLVCSLSVTAFWEKLACKNQNTYSYFNERCRKADSIRTQDDMGNFFTNFTKLNYGAPLQTINHTDRYLWYMYFHPPHGSDRREITVKSQRFTATHITF